MVAAIFVSAVVADPIIALAITAAILRITWQSWLTVRHDVRSSAHHP